MIVISIVCLKVLILLYNYLHTFQALLTQSIINLYHSLSVSFDASGGSNQAKRDGLSDPGSDQCATSEAGSRTGQSREAARGRNGGSTTTTTDLWCGRMRV